MPVFQEVLSPGVWGYGGTAGGEAQVKDPLCSREEPAFGVYVFYSHKTVLWEVGASWLWRGVGPVCRAWRLGAEAGRLPYCTCLFSQKCQRGGVRLVNRPLHPQPALRGVTCAFLQVVTESVQ